MLYLVLGAAGLLMWWAAWRRHGLLRASTMFLVSGAVVGYADMVAHSLFQLYEYKPGLLPTLTSDGPLGFICAELLFVPGLATGVLLNPRYRTLRVAVLLVLLLLLIEHGFVALQLLAHTGWRLIHSAVTFLIYFWLLGAWLNRLERVGYDGVNRVVVLVAGGTYVTMFWGTLFGFVMGLWGASPEVFGESYQGLILGSILLYFTPHLIVTVAAVGLGWARTPAHYGGLAALKLAWVLALSATGLWRNAYPWVP
ncbi:MAG: hypothetical protein ACOY94_08340, partial [Bacillota bacterium]